MPKLPTGYTELSYIQSTGTQYVDTGLKPNQDSRVLIKLSTSETGSHTVFGADLSWTDNGFALGVGFTHYGKETGTISGVNNGSPHEVDFNKNIISMDGSTVLTMGASTFSIPHNLVLFANNRAGGIQEKTTMVLYYCRIFDGDTLLRDYIPCTNASGAVGLYDLVGKQFYGNAGTGTFTAGDAVVYGPSTPSSIEVMTLSDSTAKAQWSSVDEATGYQLFINDSLVADTTNTEYVFPTIPFSAYTLSVLAYNDNGKSDTVKTSYNTIPENPCLWLVYDRTQADADRVQQMIQAGYQNLSLEQSTEWASLLSKGSWNCTDANRVGAAINFIRNLLACSGLDMSNVLPAPVSYDTKSDIRVADVTQLQESIRQLQQAFETNPAIVVMVPGPNWKYAQANQLEQNLHILYEAIKSYYIWPNAHDALCGGDYL